MVIRMKKKCILILGAGVSGLAAAWYLAEKNTGCECLLLEKASAPGGWMGSKQEGAFLLEKGPRIFKTSRNESLLEIVSAIGFSSKLIASAPEANVRYVWSGGKFQKMPTTLFSFLTSSFCRPLLIALWKERKVAPLLEEETIWDFACRRFGQIVAERFFDPLVLGIYAGDLKKLSLESCFPLLKQWESEKGSVVKGFFSSLKRAKKKREESPLFSFKGGSQAFIQEWVSKLPFQIQCGEEVVALKKEEGKWRVETTSKSFEADFVISTLPAYETSKLLQEIAPETSLLLDSFTYQDVTSLHMGWEEEVLPFSAFGYLIPQKEKEPVLGVLFDSKMFKKEDGFTLLTAMLEGTYHTEEELRVIGTRITEGHLAVLQKPTLFSFQKMRRAIPQYHVGHSEKKKALFLALKKETENFLALGNYLDGVSVNDSIQSAKKRIFDSVF